MHMKALCCHVVHSRQDFLGALILKSLPTASGHACVHKVAQCQSWLVIPQAVFSLMLDSHDVLQAVHQILHALEDYYITDLKGHIRCHQYPEFPDTASTVTMLPAKVKWAGERLAPCITRRLWPSSVCQLYL
jgi:hypothetical protein